MVVAFDETKKPSMEDGLYDFIDERPKSWI